MSGSNKPKVNITTIPSTRKLLEDAVGIIEADLNRYKRIVRDSEEQLSPAEARTIATYITALTGIEKNERDARKQLDPSDMSDEEIVEVLLANPDLKKTLTKKLGEKK